MSLHPVTQRRLSKGMASANALADAAGVARGTVNAVERGAVSPQGGTVIALAKALGVDAGVLAREIAEHTTGKAAA